MTLCDLDLDLPAVNSCEQMLEPELKLFKEAARRGVHRTVHAGEAGPACMVQIVSFYLIIYLYIQRLPQKKR